MSIIPDGPERQQLFFEGKRVMAAYAPYHMACTGSHRSRLAVAVGLSQATLLADRGGSTSTSTPTMQAKAIK